MPRKPGSVSRNVQGETPFPNPEGYKKMKFNQDLLIFKAVAIMCFYSSVILGTGGWGQKNQNPKKKIATATEIGSGTPHVQPLRGFKMGKKNEPNRSNLF